MEKALRSQPASMETIGHAVAAVRQDVQPGKLPDAEFLVAAAEGVLFEGLASLLQQVTFFQQTLQNTTYGSMVGAGLLL